MSSIAQAAGLPRAGAGPRRRFHVRWSRFFLYLLVIAFAVAYVAPFLWMAITAFKDEKEVYLYPPSFWPQRPTWSSIETMWKGADWPRYFFNTFFVAASVTLLKVCLSSLAGYALTFRFRGSKFVLFLILGTMMIPEETTLVAKYLIMKNLHWIDTYLALIVPGATGAFSIFLFRQFFLSLPKDFADAAQVDGCGQFRFLAKIGLPLAKSTALTVGLLAFIDEWNSTLWPLIVTNKDEMRVLQVALKIFSDIDTGMGWNVMMAACLLCTLPIVVFFFFVQKQFIDGIASSGIKG